MTDTKTAELVTRKHMQRVSQLCNEAAIEMINRGINHDQSKLLAIEIEPLQEMQDLIEKYGQAPFESDEYKRRTAMLKPMLDHHYKNNSHHPEHYENGVNGMDLFDLLEMILDWKAASERGEASTMSLDRAIQRFNIEPQLAEILSNTVKRKGWVA